MPEPAKRATKNAPGDFFVHEGQCFACQICVEAAPNLMALEDEDAQCYFKEQPYTLAEVEQALEAYASCCIGAVDYEGTDPVVLQRIAEINAKYR